MAGGEAACQPARKTLAGLRLRGEGPGPRFAPLPVLSPPLTQMAYTYYGFRPQSEDVMSGFNLAASSKEEQDKVVVDLMASGVAYKERLAMPVVAELVAREQPEHLRAYFLARLEHYRQLSKQLPDKNAPEYARNEDDVKK